MRAHYKAASYMTGAMLSFTLMAIAGRQLSNRLDTFEIMMFRSLAGIPVMLIFAYYYGTLVQIKFDKLRLHTLRNLFHFTGQNLWFFALPIIPLSQLFAFEFTTPLWVIILAPFFLGEKLTSARAAAVTLGFLGIIFIVNPEGTSFNFGVLAAAFCALAFAGTFLTTKTLTKSESITCILFWLVIMQSIFGLILSGFDGEISTPESNEITWVLIISLCGLTAHYCIANALLLGSAMLIVPLDFLRLPLITVIGFFLYQEQLSWQIIFGAILVFVANILNIRAEGKVLKSNSNSNGAQI